MKWTTDHNLVNSFLPSLCGSFFLLIQVFLAYRGYRADAQVLLA